MNKAPVGHLQPPETFVASINQQIGELVRFFRGVLKQSQPAFGSLINTTQDNVSDLERGKIGPNSTLPHRVLGVLQAQDHPEGKTVTVLPKIRQTTRSKIHIDLVQLLVQRFAGIRQILARLELAYGQDVCQQTIPSTNILKHWRQGVRMMTLADLQRIFGAFAELSPVDTILPVSGDDWEQYYRQKWLEEHLSFWEGRDVGLDIALLEAAVQLSGYPWQVKVLKELGMRGQYATQLYNRKPVAIRYLSSQLIACMEAQFPEQYEQWRESWKAETKPKQRQQWQTRIASLVEKKAIPWRIFAYVADCETAEIRSGVHAMLNNHTQSMYCSPYLLLKILFSAGKWFDKNSALFLEQETEQAYTAGVPYPDLRAQKRLWGVENTDLAKYHDSFSARDLDAFDSRKRRTHQPDHTLEQELITLCNEVGEEYHAGALERLESLRRPKTVAIALQHLLLIHERPNLLVKHTRPAVEQFCKKPLPAKSGIRGFSPADVEALQVGDCCLPLPLLRIYLEDGGKLVDMCCTQELEDDWRLQFAEHLQGQHKHQLVRIVFAIIYECVLERKEFFAEKEQAEPGYYNRFKKWIRNLNEGKNVGRERTAGFVNDIVTIAKGYGFSGTRLYHLQCLINPEQGYIVEELHEDPVAYLLDAAPYQIELKPRCFPGLTREEIDAFSSHFKEGKIGPDNEEVRPDDTKFKIDYVTGEDEEDDQ